MKTSKELWNEIIDQFNKVSKEELLSLLVDAQDALDTNGDPFYIIKVLKSSTNYQTTQEESLTHVRYYLGLEDDSEEWEEE